MKPRFKIFNKKKLYKGFFEINELSFIHQKYDGTWSGEIKRELFKGLQVAAVLPYDPVKKEIVLIQQFRPGVISIHKNSYLHEIVAGIIDKNEKPEKTAMRECLEETGCKINNIIPIQSYFLAPGSSESFYYLYLGEIESFNGSRIKGLKDEDEDILVSSFKVDQVRKMLNDKLIINSLTLIALQWFFLNYYKG